jgi:hypothetical protein
MKTSHTFTAKEADVVVPFKCDVHGWMNAYAACSTTRTSRCRSRRVVQHPEPPARQLHAGGVARKARTQTLKSRRGKGIEADANFTLGCRQAN